MDTSTTPNSSTGAQDQDPPVSSASPKDNSSKYNVDGASEVSSSSPQDSKRPNLKLQIPPRSFDDLYGKPPLSPGSARSSKIPGLNRLARPSFKFRGGSTPSPVSKLAIFSLGSNSSSPKQPRVSPTASFSLAKMFPARRTSSLPVTPVADASIGSQEQEQEQEQVDETISAKLIAVKFKRSLSLPLKKSRSLKKNDGVIVVRPATPQAELSKESPSSPKDQEIPAEQAVCRICMDELGEGGSTFKMQCSCKGELALAHEACVLKWFGIKGNKTCDVCGEEVQNLPVMLLRLSNDGAVSRQQNSPASRLMETMWQDIPVLIMISILAYFCLLEQLLAKDFGSEALVMALPFACVIGPLASLTAATLVSRKFIWGYAALQFLLVIFFAHLFYNVMKMPRMLQRHVEAVISILLSTCAGFGLTMGVNGVCLEYSSWRRRRHQHQHQQEQQQQQHQQTQNVQQDGQEHIDIELGHSQN